MKKCEICKKPHDKKRFCSIKCRAIGSGEFNKRTGLKPPSRKGIPWTKEALEKRQKTRVERGSNKPSKETIEKMKKTTKAHYDKVGRRSGVVSLLKRTNKYRNWRKRVFERDNYTCQICNKRGGYIESDHIIPKAILIKRCGATIEKCLQYRPLWEIKNGRTLCKECHRKTSTYGGKVHKLLKDS